jgi:hypothetical protein
MCKSEIKSSIKNCNHEKQPFKFSGYARVIRGLPELVHLERGDFLCDVNDFCCEQNLLLVPSNLKIQEFYASEEYYFHSEEQVSNKVLQQLK